MPDLESVLSHLLNVYANIIHQIFAFTHRMDVAYVVAIVVGALVITLMM